MIFFDTESVGKTGPLVLIQFAFLSDLEQCRTGEDYKRVIKIHHIWDNTVEETLAVITGIIEHPGGVCGFNLAHDIFMLNKWWNVFSRIPSVENRDGSPPLASNAGSLLPDLVQVGAYEQLGPRSTDKVLKPVSSLDLLIIAKSTKYQYLAKHKNVYIKKVPIAAIEPVIEALNEINQQLPRGIRIRWRESDSKKYQRHDIKDIVGEFFPSSSFNSHGHLKPGGAKKRTVASLKQLTGIIRNDPSLAEKDFESEVGFPHYDEEPDWKPWGGAWENATKHLANTFRFNETAINYARNDIIYTYELYLDLGKPQPGDDDSELASLVGAMQWKGFAVAPEEVLRGKINEYIASVAEVRKLGVNANSPQSVLSYLHEQCTDDMERLGISDTKKTTLEELSRWEGHPIQNAVKLVKKARQAEKRKNILQKLIEAKRFTFSMKVSGTLSNRMSGGQEDASQTSESSGGKLNAQGIPRVKDFRSLFLLAFPDETLEGGDFSAFEPCILDSLVGDPQFSRDLQSGTKIHVFVGAEFYNCDPLVIAASEGTEDDIYIKSKNGFLGWIYGAMQAKVAKVLDLPEKDVEAGYQRIKQRYPVLSQYRDALLQRYSPVKREEGKESGKIIWEEPDGFIESKRLPWQSSGFRRSFILEWSVIKGIYQLASEPTVALLQIPGTVRRTNRSQTIPNAIRSALFASIFGYQSHVFRAAANHEIQSPGAQITKHLQRLIWDLQLPGIRSWHVRPMNNHDEVMCCVSKEKACHKAIIAPLAEGLPLGQQAPAIIPAVGLMQDRDIVLPQEVQAQFLNSLLTVIPQLKMKWKTNLKNWAEK